MRALTRSGGAEDAQDRGKALEEQVTSRSADLTRKKKFGFGDSIAVFRVVTMSRYRDSRLCVPHQSSRRFPPGGDKVINGVPTVYIRF